MSEPKPEKIPARAGPGYLFVVLLTLIVSAITAATTVAIYDRRYAQKIVVMDLQGYIRQQRDLMAAGKLDQDQLRQGLDAMEAALLAVPANHTVLMKDVVLRNAPEIKP